MRPRRPSATAARAERGGSRRPPRSLKSRAIALLARRDYSRAELRQKLLRARSDADDAFESVSPDAPSRDDPHDAFASPDPADPLGAADAPAPHAGRSRAEEIEALLDELAQLGYLSDERYARGVVARKSTSHSRRAIAEELKARGVGSEAVRSAIEAGEADDAATMRALWQRRFGAAPRDDTEKARQVRFLQSRGFALSAILRFLRELPAGDESAS